MRDSVNYYIFFLTVFTDSGIRISTGQQTKCVNNRILGNNALWKCTDRTKCALASTLPRRNTVKCGEGKICCPEARTAPVGIKTGVPEAPRNKTSFTHVNQIAKNKCHEYLAYRYRNYSEQFLIGQDPVRRSKLDCYDNDLKAVVPAGNDASLKEFPHMAFLGHDEDVTASDGCLCGGSLISDQFILSAARCTTTDKGELVKWAALGIVSKLEIAAAAIIGKHIFPIRERFNHPLYKRGNSTYENNDIALYRLDNPIEFSPLIRPICIHYQPLAFGASAYTTGWGQLLAGGVESDHLQKAVITNWDPKECLAPYANDPFLKNGFDRQSMICGGHLSNGINACSAEPGGPMQIRVTGETCAMIQVGIMSRGPAYCDEKAPAIYTRVSPYLRWIQSIVWPN